VCASPRLCGRPPPEIEEKVQSRDFLGDEDGEIDAFQRARADGANAAA